MRGAGSRDTEQEQAGVEHAGGDALHRRGGHELGRKRQGHVASMLEITHSRKAVHDTAQKQKRRER